MSVKNSASNEIKSISLKHPVLLTKFAVFTNNLVDFVGSPAQQLLHSGQVFGVLLLLYVLMHVQPRFSLLLKRRAQNNKMLFVLLVTYFLHVYNTMNLCLRRKYNLLNAEINKKKCYSSSGQELLLLIRFVCTDFVFCSHLLAFPYAVACGICRP